MSFRMPMNRSPALKLAAALAITLSITTAVSAPPPLPENAGPGTLRAVLDDYEQQAVSGVQDEEIVTFAAPEHFYQLWLDAIDAAIAADPNSPARPAARLVRVSLLNGVGNFQAAARELREIAARSGTAHQRTRWYALALGSQTHAVQSAAPAHQAAAIDEGVELLGLAVANFDPQSTNASALATAASAIASFVRTLDTASLLALDESLTDLADDIRSIQEAFTASANPAAQQARDRYYIDPGHLLASEFQMRVILNQDQRVQKILDAVATQPNFGSLLTYQTSRLETVRAMNGDNNAFFTSAAALIDQHDWDAPSCNLATTIFAESGSDWPDRTVFLLSFYTKVIGMDWISDADREIRRAMIAGALSHQYRESDNDADAERWREIAFNHHMTAAALNTQAPVEGGN